MALEGLIRIKIVDRNRRGEETSCLWAQRRGKVVTWHNLLGRVVEVVDVWDQGLVLMDVGVGNGATEQKSPGGQGRRRRGK
jgi:hypothetical protein